MRKVKLSFALILLALFALACSSFVQNGYKSLTISFQAYDVTLSTMGDLYREGKLTDAQRDKAVQIARGYKLAHNGAVTALAMYESTQSENDKTAYLKASATAASELAKLLAYCRPFIDKEVK